jgi:hypothetical protein
LKRAEERAARMAGRFTRKAAGAGKADAAAAAGAAGGPGENVLERMVAHHKTALAGRIKAVEQAIAERKRARELMEGYAFKVDADPFAAQAQAGGIFHQPLGAVFTNTYPLWGR